MAGGICLARCGRNPGGRERGRGEVAVRTDTSHRKMWILTRPTSWLDRMQPGAVPSQVQASGGSGRVVYRLAAAQVRSLVAHGTDRPKRYRT